jgi:hypothetical protein
MMLRHAPMNTSVTLALPKPRLHVTMKCEHELRRDLNPSQRRDSHKSYIPSSPSPFNLKGNRFVLGYKSMFPKFRIQPGYFGTKYQEYLPDYTITTLFTHYHNVIIFITTPRSNSRLLIHVA